MYWSSTDDCKQFNPTSNIEKLLITKEAYWSAQLFSLAPFGLNKRQAGISLEKKNKLQLTKS